MSNVNYERRKAVAEAWKNEKHLVMDGKGTRDWEKKEQQEILLKGKATGYQGHHMKSVAGHNEHAGESNNIQFLTRREHLAAHNGNYRNNTNGYYDPKTGKMHDFGEGKAHVEAKELSKPLSDDQRNKLTSKSHLSKRAEAAKNKAQETEYRSVIKPKGSSQHEANAESHYKSKTLATQRSSTSGETSRDTTKSKTLSEQRKNDSSKESSHAVDKSQSVSNNSSNKKSKGPIH